MCTDFSPPPPPPPPPRRLRVVSLCGVWTWTCRSELFWCVDVGVVLVLVLVLLMVVVVVVVVSVVVVTYYTHQGFRVWWS